MRKTATIFNPQELGIALGLNYDEIRFHMKCEGFPIPSYVSGKRRFWSIEDLPIVAAWCEKNRKRTGRWPKGGVK